MERNYKYHYECLDLVDKFSNEYKFDECIKYTILAYDELIKGYKLCTKYKKYSATERYKYLIWRDKSGEFDFYYKYGRVGEFWLKIGTTFAIDYWNSLKNCEYYEEMSYFKVFVDGMLEMIEEKQKQGYVYKPLTKVNQAIFLEYAKTKGWR